jgi:hypothetical protein
MTRVVLVGLLLVAAAAGCGSLRNNPAEPPEPVDAADAIDLWANPPVAVNWDDVPGPDGVRTNVFLYRADRAAPVLVKGTLEVTMYEGRIHEADILKAVPRQTWTLTEQELATRQMRGPPGWGYYLQLGWGRNVPASAIVTVLACYKSPKRPPIYSAPLVVSVGK